ncbi:MAG TPA: DUF4398 domain-containing protein [Burkholderiaceae bacterium]|jgi:hypothetical protein
MTTLIRTPSQRPLRSLILPGLLLSTAALLGACASSTPPPTTQMAVADAAVQAANTPSTSEAAPAELQLAVNKLALAHQAMNDKNYDRALYLAEQTQVDAQVAQQHAQSVRSRKAAQDSEDAARALQDEINRKAGS